MPDRRVARPSCDLRWGGKPYFALQPARRLGRVAGVKVVIAVLLLSGAASAVQAQDQDRKLLDRVLKPNMELKNSSQDKAFRASGVSDSKKADTHSFQYQDKTETKSFADKRSFFARLFKPKSFYDGDQTSFVDGQKNAAVSTYAAGAKTVAVQQAQPQEKQVNTRDFDDSKHEFRDRGKSPKSLEQKNHPLTIDEVRELLNKNK